MIARRILAALTPPLPRPPSEPQERRQHTSHTPHVPCAPHTERTPPTQSTAPAQTTANASSHRTNGPRAVRGSNGGEPALTERDALRVLTRLATHLVRGWLRRPFLGSCAGRLLVGRGVTIHSPERLHVGRGVKLEDLCEVQCLARDGVTLGDGVTVGRGVSLRPGSYYGGALGEGLSVGPGTAIGAFSWIGCSGAVTLGADVLLGPRVVILPENHRFDDVVRRIKDQGVERSTVVVEDDCWLGANVTVLAGVRIGRGAVVAPGAVVTRDVAPGAVVAGVPARFVRWRGLHAQRSPGRSAA
jgi:acetyltransferase-like isoleucine patch superfamily enzyme